MLIHEQITQLHQQIDSLAEQIRTLADQKPKALNELPQSEIRQDRRHQTSATDRSPSQLKRTA